MMKEAPLYNDLAEGPEGGDAWWMHADDGVRLRAAYWPGGDKGTVFMFPGRTEYVEKYGRAAADLAKRGFGMVTIDWRGQGLSDRLLDNPTLGHVVRFSDYQLDARALMAEARLKGLPEPYYMIAHSMGGCIGLRALHNDFPVKSAVFSGPMWGIMMAPHLRPVSWIFGTLMVAIGQGGRKVPGTSSESYVLENPFEDNMLTSDEDMFNYMVRQTRAISGVALAAPTLQWLIEALRETRALRAMAPTSHEIVTFLGGNERIVDPRFVHQIMDKWPNGTLVLCDGAEHEIVMEQPATRDEFFDRACALFENS